jgi:hypothetical protein
MCQGQIQVEWSVKIAWWVWPLLGLFRAAVFLGLEPTVARADRYADWLIRRGGARLELRS